MRQYNDSVLGMLERHFGNRERDSSTDIALAFNCANKVARKVEPEAFYELYSNITTRDHVEYFHKGFRQVDVFEIPPMDSLFYNIIAQFEAAEWDMFQSFMTDLMAYNNQPAIE